MQVGIEHNLGIAVSRKTKSGLLELGTQLMMIEDFPVENECNVAVWTLKRLVPSLKIDYSKPCSSERYLSRCKPSLMIWTAVID
jgi:hypothetical protein